MSDPIAFGRPFVLRRDRDISGVSGTGIIADGILFPDGHAAIHWRGKWALTTPHPDGMDSILAIHDHGGQGDLHVIWADHDELRQSVLAGVVEAFDVPPEVCGTEAEAAYLRKQITKAVDEAWRVAATSHQWAERTRTEIVDAVMPFVGHLQSRRDELLRATGRAYRLAYNWQGAHGSANILVRAAGAELRDALDDSEAAPAEVVHSIPNGQVNGAPRVDYPAAAECSAQWRGFDDSRQCIRAAQHRGYHIDERGFHWSDTVAVYPVHDGPENEAPASEPRCVCGDPIEWYVGPDSAGWIHRPVGNGPILDVHKPRPAPTDCEHRGAHPGFTCAEVDQSKPFWNVRWDEESAARPSRDQGPPDQGPLTGVEVRDPCPYCEGCPLIPRHLMDDHIRDNHSDIRRDNSGPTIPNHQVNEAESADSTADTSERREQIFGALKEEYLNRVADRVVASPKQHIEGLADAVMPVVERLIAEAEQRSAAACRLPHEMEV